MNSKVPKVLPAAAAVNYETPYTIAKAKAKGMNEVRPAEAMTDAELAEKEEESEEFVPWPGVPKKRVMFIDESLSDADAREKAKKALERDLELIEDVSECAYERHEVDIRTAIQLCQNSKQTNDERQAAMNKKLEKLRTKIGEYLNKDESLSAALLSVSEFPHMRSDSRITPLSAYILLDLCIQGYCESLEMLVGLTQGQIRLMLECAWRKPLYLQKQSHKFLSVIINLLQNGIGVFENEDYCWTFESCYVKFISNGENKGKIIFRMYEGDLSEFFKELNFNKRVPDCTKGIPALRTESIGFIYMFLKLSIKYFDPTETECVSDIYELDRNYDTSHMDL